MTKKERYDLYKFQIGPGWWAFLDKYVAQIMAADPDCELSVREKYGTLQLDIHSDKINHEQRREWEAAAEAASAEICECCGRPGSLRTIKGWSSTFCDRCCSLENSQGFIVCEETEHEWWNTAEE